MRVRVQNLRQSLFAAAAALAMTTASNTAIGKPERERIALTFDDLPGLTIRQDQAYVNELNDAILRGLLRHHLPAIGFVNEGKLDEIDRAQQIANLRKWLDAGMNLGNHTFSHESPSYMGVRGYIADIARGEPVTKRLLAEHHQRMEWFRPPYLETGFHQATRTAIDTWLSKRGYRLAPVTINADDWVFAEPYDDAIARHDEARRQRIRAQYLQYTERMVDWSRKAARVLFGRGISYVMLLHATRLNADCMDSLAAMLRRDHLEPVSLEDAMRDPAYHTLDHYAGRDGIEWLERWSRVLHKELPWQSFSNPPAWIHREYDRIDSRADTTPR